MIEANKINIVANPRNIFFNPKKAKDHMPLKKSCKKKAVVPKFCVFILKLYEKKIPKAIPIRK